MAFNLVADPPPEPPKALPSAVKRTNPDGSPTVQQLQHDQKMDEWRKAFIDWARRVAQAIP